MNTIQSIFSPEITEALGWTIVHAIWQGIVVLLSLLILLALLHKYSAQVRYFISFTALIVLLGWSASTFIKAYGYAVEKQTLKTTLLNNPSYFKTASYQTETSNNAVVNAIDFRNVRVRAWFQRHFPIFLSIWLVGIGLFSVRLIGGLAYNRRLRGLQLLPFEEKWMNTLLSFADRLNIRHKVKAYKSPHTTTPLTLGYLKPIILFPVKAFSGLSEKEIEAIIAHELAHIVRHDYLFNIIQSIIEILFFYHPAVWAISKHIRIEREHSCDDIAINLTGDQVTYAKALTQAHIFSFQQENLSMAFARKKGSLLERIKRIQKQRAMKTNITEGLIAAFIIISSIFLVSFSLGNQFNTDYTQNTGKTTTNTTVGTPTPPPAIKVLKKVDRDSIVQEVSKNIEKVAEIEPLSKEIEQAVEIALSEKNAALSVEIIEEINSALKEINFDVVIEKSLQEANEALNEADIEISAAFNEIDMDSLSYDIQLELKEAQEAIKYHMEANKEKLDSLKINIDISDASLHSAQTGLEIAADVLENLDIEVLVENSLEAAEVAIKLADEELENLNIDSMVNAEMKKAHLEIAKEKEILDAEKDQLKKEMKQLKKEMKQLKKELKQEMEDND
ncbi:hypothetical protein E9993_21045 [Labilibacter sediminis]|nr:hypothetical protein E9993_21045 [Labilibacter sediminis]